MLACGEKLFLPSPRAPPGYVLPGEGRGETPVFEG